MLLATLCCLLASLTGTLSDTTVTIYNEFLAMGGRVHYETDRWNKHNGLTQSNLVSPCKSIGTEAGRWLNRDLNDNLFADWPQDPHREGYPDPQYLTNHSLAQEIFQMYMDNIHLYGHDINLVWETKSLSWPNWMDKSQHKGVFPNNVDAAAEMVALMVGGLKDFAGGHLPPFFEVINEPDASWQIFNSTTTIAYHKAVALKLKSRFNIEVGGPTYTSYVARTDSNDFHSWTTTKQFLDFSLFNLDFFSFHAYNGLTVKGSNHSFEGINEARLVAYIDMLENYSFKKRGVILPLIVSEYGRGPVQGISKDAHSNILDFATIFNSIAHRFTYLGMREFMERAVVFLASNGQYPGHNSLNWSLFTKDGNATQLVMVYKFWQHLTDDFKFLRFSSEYSGSERQVSPQVFANPGTNELVVILLNYGNNSQNVSLDFSTGWMNATTGLAVCISYQDGRPVMQNFPFDTDKFQGKVALPGEGICMYRFNTSFNFNIIRTTNENTYYSTDMVIPIKNGRAQVIIVLPASSYHTARMRVGVSRNLNSTAKPKTVSINGFALPSTFMLYDSDKYDAPTKWQVWEYEVPEPHVQTSNTVAMEFDGDGGYVSSVALVLGTLI